LPQKGGKLGLAGRNRNTLEHCTGVYLDHLRVNVSALKYIKEHERQTALASSAWGASTPVKQVTRQMAQSLVNEEAVRHLKADHSNHAVNHTIRCLRAFFNFCIQVLEIEMGNPFTGVKFLPVSMEKKHVPTDAEIYVVRNSLEPHQKRLFDFVEQTGCRVNEALRLKVEDIREDTLTLYTRKSKNSNLTGRVIPRPECLRDEDLPTDPKARVFPQWNVLPRFLAKHVAKANAEPNTMTSGEDWSWHNLRHAAASKWAQANMPVFEISARLGHTSVKTTTIYLQLLGFTVVPFTSIPNLGAACSSHAGGTKFFIIVPSFRRFLPLLLSAEVSDPAPEKRERAREEG
jgi:integrase